MEEIIMEVQEGMEREINLVELFWRILFGWRQIVCFGIIFAVLFAGMKYARDVKFYRTTQNTDLDKIAEELSNEEMQQVTAAKTLITRIEEYENYLETSVLMQIDSYKKSVVELQYYVESDYTFNYTQESKPDYTQNLMSLYYNYIVSGNMSRNVIKDAKLSIEQEDFSELLSVSVTSNSILIKITSPKADDMDAIANSIKNQLEEKETEFQAIGIHKLKLLGESKNVVVDSGLVDRKGAISNTISTLNTQLNTLKSSMSEKQKDLLDSEEDQEGNSKEVGAIPHVNLKYVVLGIAFGVVLVCAWITFMMVFSVTLQNSDELRKQYSIRLLGEINVQPRKKHFLVVIDDILLKIKNRRKKKLSVEQQIKIISANIELYCMQRGINCIYMTGSEYESMDTVVLELLKKELASQHIQVKEGGNIFYDSESLKLGTEVGNIIFIEQVGKSIYDEISNELILAKEQKANILGLIVLG